MGQPESEEKALLQERSFATIGLNLVRSEKQTYARSNLYFESTRPWLFAISQEGKARTAVLVQASNLCGLIGAPSGPLFPQWWGEKLRDRQVEIFAVDNSGTRARLGTTSIHAGTEIALRLPVGFSLDRRAVAEQLGPDSYASIHLHELMDRVPLTHSAIKLGDLPLLRSTWSFLSRVKRTRDLDTLKMLELSDFPDIADKTTSMIQPLSAGQHFSAYWDLSFSAVEWISNVIARHGHNLLITDNIRALSVPSYERWLSSELAVESGSESEGLNLSQSSSGDSGMPIAQEPEGLDSIAEEFHPPGRDWRVWPMSNQVRREMKRTLAELKGYLTTEQRLQRSLTAEEKLLRAIFGPQETTAPEPALSAHKLEALARAGGHRELAQSFATASCNYTYLEQQGDLLPDDLEAVAGARTSLGLLLANDVPAPIEASLGAYWLPRERVLACCSHLNLTIQSSGQLLITSDETTPNLVLLVRNFLEENPDASWSQAWDLVLQNDPKLQRISSINQLREFETGVRQILRRKGIKFT